MIGWRSPQSLRLVIFCSPPNRRPSLRPWRRRFDTKLRSKSEYICTQYLTTVFQLNVWLHCLKLFSLCRPIQKPGQRGICKRCLRLVVHMPWDHFTCERWCNSSPFLWFHVSIGSVSYVFVMKSLCKISCWRVYIRLYIMIFWKERLLYFVYYCIYGTVIILQKARNSLFRISRPRLKNCKNKSTSLQRKETLLRCGWSSLL